MGWYGKTTNGGKPENPDYVRLDWDEYHSNTDSQKKQTARVYTGQMIRIEWWDGHQETLEVKYRDIKTESWDGYKVVGTNCYKEYGVLGNLHGLLIFCSLDKMFVHKDDLIEPPKFQDSNHYIGVAKQIIKDQICGEGI